MSTEKEKLTTLSYVTDTDVGYTCLGDIEGMFQKDQLKDYIKRYGHEQLCCHLGFLQFQIWEALREINSEKDGKDAVASA